MDDLKALMNETLNSLGIRAECVNTKKHRHLAFFDLKLNKGCKVSRIEGFAREISLSIKSKTSPIVISIPKLGIVRLKVAFDDADIIDLKELYSKYVKPEGILPFLLGETDEGQPLWVDIATNPHMLIAGTTGSGKSTLLHSIIINALTTANTNLYLSDPKSGVEFGIYEKYAKKICTTYEDTLEMLEHIHKQMNSRFEDMKKRGVRDNSDNHYCKSLVIIDEVADLIIYDADKRNPNSGKLEKLIVSIAQKARASGIYMILATQRPSVDVITGLIKANFPARISCKVSSATDSKVILDRVGAESLLGKGDSIIKSSAHDFVRFQSAIFNGVV